jgi:hypothetical protein
LDLDPPPVHGANGADIAVVLTEELDQALAQNGTLLTAACAVRMIMFVAAKLEARKAPRCG